MDSAHASQPPISQRRASTADSNSEGSPNSKSVPQNLNIDMSRVSRRKASPHRGRPRPLPTPRRVIASPLPHPLLTSAPASPPTPAPSPTPHQRAPTWTTAGEEEDDFLRYARTHFRHLDREERERFLAEVLNLCDNHQLSFVHHFVSPRLKKDPFQVFPNELCLRVLVFVDHPRTLARASQVSRRWHELLKDDMTWKIQCEKHAYRQMSEDSSDETSPLYPPLHNHLRPLPLFAKPRSPKRNIDSLLPGPSNSAPNLSTTIDGSSTPPLSTKYAVDTDLSPRLAKKRKPKTMSYRSHFKQRYLVELAWRKGGHCKLKHITPEQGVVTSLHLTSKYIVVALDNAKIHVFNTDGEHQKTLQGHVMGVWAMVPWGDTLVSGGCDRDVRVWDMSTGESQYVLRGHTSTVRCLKMSDANTAISGSRDTTLRIWDIRNGTCKHVLVGHQASVRCLAIHGDLVVSGSYDTTARIWSISDGRSIRVLQGHFSQIYAIAFDGHRIATGSLDTSVRIWDPESGQCQAILQGHTSLVGQLQMRGDTLVTGGSDGSVRVWSLEDMVAIHRLAAHDNSVTSLQFDDTRIVSGGSDGRVKIWSLRTGQLIRELSQPAEAVWRVAFEPEKAVIMASRSNRTVMEVWSFAPPPEENLSDSEGSDSPVSMPDHLLPEASKQQSLPIDHDGDQPMVDVYEDVSASASTSRGR
ncbi:MAG: hypothetical protein M1834_002151 [Cirrosporium novae-zelandiae]|nr:MAG: hypothetical protein M1834_002151 [Cirrosporium novae-zelandiae]